MRDRCGVGFSATRRINIRSSLDVGILTYRLPDRGNRISEVAQFLPKLPIANIRLVYGKSHVRFRFVDRIAPKFRPTDLVFCQVRLRVLIVYARQLAGGTDIIDYYGV